MKEAALIIVPACVADRVQHAGRGDRSPSRPSMNSTAETLMTSPRVSLKPVAEATSFWISATRAAICSGVAVVAQDGGQPLLVDDHGDRHLGDGVAVADGRDLLGVHLVVGGLFLALALLGRLRAVGRGEVCASGRFCSTVVGATGRFLAGVLVRLHHLDRALDARFRIEDRLLGLARVGVHVGLDAGAEIVRAEIGRQGAADVVLDLQSRRCARRRATGWRWCCWDRRRRRAACRWNRGR